MYSMTPPRSSLLAGTARAGRAAHETPERAVRQVIASSRLEGCPDPTPEQEARLLSVASGEKSADDAVAEILSQLR